MGLWEYCFYNFRYPYYQFDHPFDGCHHVFSHEYHVIREWLLPSWLIAVQAFVTMSFLLSFGSQVLMAMQLCRWPLEFILRYEWILSGIDFVCVTTVCKYSLKVGEELFRVGNYFAAVFMFFAIAIFGGSHMRRDWLMYPNFNYLCWSYGFACLSFFFHGFGAVCLYKECRLSYERRRESKNLIMQMQPNPQHRLGWNLPGYQIVAVLSIIVDMYQFHTKVINTNQFIEQATIWCETSIIKNNLF